MVLPSRFNGFVFRTPSIAKIADIRENRLAGEPDKQSNSRAKVGLILI
jgi:hypothetical protein